MSKGFGKFKSLNLFRARRENRTDLQISGGANISILHTVLLRRIDASVNRKKHLHHNQQAYQVRQFAGSGTKKTRNATIRTMQRRVPCDIAPSEPLGDRHRSPNLKHKGHIPILSHFLTIAPNTIFLGVPHVTYPAKPCKGVRRSSPHVRIHVRTVCACSMFFRFHCGNNRLIVAPRE